MTKPKMTDLQSIDDQVVTMIVHRTLFFTPDPSHSPPSDFDLHSDLTWQTNHRIITIEVGFLDRSWKKKLRWRFP